MRQYTTTNNVRTMGLSLLDLAQSDDFTAQEIDAIADMPIGGVRESGAYTVYRVADTVTCDD